MGTAIIPQRRRLQRFSPLPGRDVRRKRENGCSGVLNVTLSTPFLSCPLILCLQEDFRILDDFLDQYTGVLIGYEAITLY